jgi:hypothetical protein
MLQGVFTKPGLFAMLDFQEPDFTKGLLERSIKEAG